MALLVQELDQAQPEARDRPQLVADTYIREDFEIQGTVDLYESRGPARLLELSLAADPGPWEAALIVDDSKMQGSWDYWRKLSAMSSGVDAFETPEGHRVLRFQDIYYRHSLKLLLTSPERVKIYSIISRVAPVEHG